MPSVYSFEALFGAFGAWLIIGEKLTPSAVLGGSLMFASILMCQFCTAQKLKPNRRTAEAAAI
jgi:drug/metabolite transporter (DMT)-like permease